MSFQDDQVFLEKYLDENLNTVLGLRLAGKYISSDNLEGAHLILSEFLESHPNNPTGKFLMGEIAFKEGNNDKAKSHYEDTIQVDPTYVAAYHRLVTICNDDGDEAGVTEIYRLLNLVIPMDKKAAAEIEGKEEADASKSNLAKRIQNKFLLSPVADSGTLSDAEELTGETEENVDSLADELSSKLDAEESTNSDEPIDGVKDETDTEEENKETEVPDLSAEDKDSDEGEAASDKEEDSVAPDETDSIEPTDESRVESEDTGSEEDLSSIEESETTEVDAFGVSVGDDEIESASPEEESIESIKDEEKSGEELSSGEESESTEVDAFGIGERSEETSEEESSDAGGSDIISEDIAPEEDSGNGDVETATEEPFTEETKQVDESDSDEESEEISSAESFKENEAELDSDEGESSDSADSSEETTLEKETDETGSESLAESTDESVSELDSSVVDEDNRTFEMPPFSEETLSDVVKSEESASLSEKNLESKGEAETEKEEIDEDTNDNVDEGVVSPNLPLDSTVDAADTEDNIIAEENDSNEQSEDGKSVTDEHNISIDSVKETDKGLLETPSDFESWVEKDVTPESMTTGEGDADENQKNTFEGLLSEDETSGEVDTMELPEESAAGLAIEEERDLHEKIDDIYSLAQLDDDEDVSPLQAWFLERKTPHDEQGQNEHQAENEEDPDPITEPKPVPFSGESEEEAEALQDTEENESEEKWDKFVDRVVEKKGGDDPKDRDSASTDIDRELRNIFDEVAAPVNEQDINEANADAPDITGGVKLNSDLATFTLADIYINQSQFNEALSVLDLLEEKGENLERVASMREEIKVKIEARNK